MLQWHHHSLTHPLLTALYSQVDAVFPEGRGAAVVDLEAQVDEVAPDAGTRVPLATCYSGATTHSPLIDRILHRHSGLVVKASAS